MSSFRNCSRGLWLTEAAEDVPKRLFY